MTREIEDRIAAAAARQHGVVTRRQLVNAGLSSDTIDHRVAVGKLRVVHRGVYLTLPFPLSHTREMAAVLASGPGAALSHLSVVSLWGYREGSGRRARLLDVSVVGNRGRVPGIRLHRVERLDRDERTVIEGIPVTTPARTLLDVATVVGTRELEALVARAEREGLVTRDVLSKALTGKRGRPGTRALRALLQMPGGPSFTRSEAEERFLALVRKARLPAPECNVRVAGYELDFFWPGLRFAVEVDGFRFHSSRSSFEEDRRKDADLLAVGTTVLRLSWTQITNEALATIGQLGQALGFARARSHE